MMVCCFLRSVVVSWTRTVVNAGLSRSRQREGGGQDVLASSLEEPSSGALLYLQTVHVNV